MRIGDHAGLAAASRRGGVVPVLVIDPEATARLRLSPRRAAYYCGAVAALDASLRARGSRLIVRRGPRARTLRALARAAGAATVAASHAYDWRGIRGARDVQASLEEAGLRVVFVHDAPVIAPEETSPPHGEGYRALAPYLARWFAAAAPDEPPEPRFAAGCELESEALPLPAEFDSPYAASSEASEAHVHGVLARFLDGPVLQYAIARNIPADGATSHLSAALSFGVIAARTVARETRRRAADLFLLVEETTSLRFFLRSLGTRDFFLQLGWFNEAAADEPLQPKMRGFRFARAHPALDEWRAGRTGFPLVDAGIRELHATGAMHPRVRAVAASCLCFDLGVDWRVGRDEWDRFLIEDEPALASGNWQWIAGLGADLAAYPRIYNPITQARRFDPQAAYIRRYIPELALVPDERVLDPGALDASGQLRLALFENAYPPPVVDHARAAREFLARYTASVRSTASPAPADRATR